MQHVPSEIFVSRFGKRCVSHTLSVLSRSISFCKEAPRYAVFKPGLGRQLVTVRLSGTFVPRTRSTY
jgi:hypothetical protein